MTDIEIARTKLEGHSICLCRNGEYFNDDGRGITTMMRFIAEGRDMKGYSAADKIVGKAAAILFIKAGIVSVHGSTMSESGKNFLESHNIHCTYDVLTEKIINRSGTDICPMEKAVADTDDIDTGYILLVNALRNMKN